MAKEGSCAQAAGFVCQAAVGSSLVVWLAVVSLLLSFPHRQHKVCDPSLAVGGGEFTEMLSRTAVLTRSAAALAARRGLRAAPSSRAALASASAAAVLAFGAQQHQWPASAEPQPTPLDQAYIPPPAKLDDPEHNSRVLESWRAHIQQARELFSKLDYDGAERALRLALEEAMHFGQSSGPVATSLLNLAQLYRRAGRLAEAQPLLERAIDVLEQTAGPNNKVTLLALLDLAATHLEQGHTEEAIAGFDDALARLDVAEVHQTHGREALREVRAGCLFRMGKAHASVGGLGDAERRLRDALSLLEERWGTASPKLLAPCAELARVLTQAGRLEEGRAFLDRAKGLPDLKPSQKEHLVKLQADLSI